jgi:hypothetical protein
MTKRLPDLDQAIHVEHLEALRRSLAEQLRQAALTGEDDAALQKLLEALKLTSRLLGLLNTLKAAAVQPHPASSSSAIEPQQGEYPRFRIDGQQLIKTGRSRNGSEYEHAVSQAAYRKILACLKRLAEECDVFTSEQVESMTKDLACPAYQMYVVLGFLRSKELLISERKGRYRFREDFASQAEQVWPRERGK